MAPLKINTPSMHHYSFFAPTPKGLESLLLAELSGLGAVEVKETRAGVSFSGPLGLAYRACLWSRLASRVLLPLDNFAAATPEALYAGVHALAWEDHLGPDDTLTVDFTTVQSQINHSHYGALKVKDAIVDRFRERDGRRPSVARERPSVRINIYLYHDQATVYLDLSGESLHRRGYRDKSVAAPLKENTACVLLIRADWPEIARAGGTLLDPMCGGGTLLIEGALMAADIAPGLLRDYFGFQGWRGHDTALWSELIAEARQRRADGLRQLTTLYGFDADPRAVEAARHNAATAGLTPHILIEQREVRALLAPPTDTPGLLAVNPPYGERLGETEALKPLYAELGAKLKEHFGGWRTAVLTADPELGKGMGIRARKRYVLFNGALECKLLCFDVTPEWFITPRPAEDDLPLSPGAEMLVNRLRKNLKTLGRWADKEQVSCYRLYDADLPEYAVAVDVYHGEKLWVHVQEYAAPASIDPQKAEARLRDALRAIPVALDIPREQLFFKIRQRQKGSAQYQASDETGEFHEVREGPCRLLVNFTAYLDTGLFLDHRPVRTLIRELARGKEFLNLFAYTGSASVHAAAGGATGTTSVDMSHTYLEWARRNMALNGYIGKQHRYIQTDCVQWLAAQSASANRQRYGLILLDPPTFSNSKRMEGNFDVQRDHVTFIRQAVALLAPGGTLLFSTNYRRFKLDNAALADLQVEDISRAMLPEDFARNPRIHQVWRIQASNA